MDFDSKLPELLFHLHSIHDRYEDVLVAFGVESGESEEHVVLRSAHFETGDEVYDFYSACGG